MTCIGKEFTFEAAHRLQNHEGQCRNLHGHSYKVEVSIEGQIIENLDAPDNGMVLDFGRLTEWWTHPFGGGAAWDHKTILEATDPLAPTLVGAGVLVILTAFPPTAENMAENFLVELQEWLLQIWPNGFITPHVKVWETAKSWAEA